MEKLKRKLAQVEKNVADSDEVSDNDIVEIEPPSSSSSNSGSLKPLCKYGSECYRKNPKHLEEFDHAQQHESTSASNASCVHRNSKQIKLSQLELSSKKIFLTKVNLTSNSNQINGDFSLNLRG